MTLTKLEQEILSHLRNLTSSQQREVLAFVCALGGAPGGVPGKDLLAPAGAVEPHDLAVLQQALDDSFSQDSRALLLQQAGALADDESLPALLEAIYAARKETATSAEN